MNIDVEFSFSAFVYIRIMSGAWNSVLQIRIATRKAHNITKHNALTYRRVYKIFVVTTCYHFLPLFSLLSRMEWDLHASARVFKSLVVDFSCVFCVFISYDLGRSDHILMGYRMYTFCFFLSSLLFSSQQHRQCFRSLLACGLARSLFSYTFELFIDQLTL